MYHRIESIKKDVNGGYALVTALIFFLAASIAVIAGLSNSVFREVKDIRNESISKQAYLTSESGLEDVIYRIKSGKNFELSGSLEMASGTASYTVISEDNGVKDVRSDGDTLGIKRNTEAVLKTGQGISFAYALQSGFGGVDLTGNSGIVGDVYTTGSLRGCSGCTVSGEAVAVGKNTSALDQDNSSPLPPPSAISFGTSNSSQDLAESFMIPSELSILQVALYVKKVGNPANATVKITTDDGGKPSDTVLASGTLSSSLVGNAFNWIDIDLTSNPILSANVIYWIVVDAGSSSNNYFIMGANNAYANGMAKVGRYNSAWNNTSPSGLDAYFKVFSGTNEIGITGTSGTLSLGSAYAYNVSYANVSDSLYCQTGTGNNKACDTSRGDPPLKDYPIPDDKINSWKAEAGASIYNGDYQVGKSGATLGPKEINGNLLITGQGTLRVSGTIYVKGNVTLNGNSFIEPADPNKSFVVIADGTILLGGGSEVLGSKDGHILLVSLSSADPAISISGGANDTVIFAPRGGLVITGGAFVKAGSAKHILVSGGARVTYDPDLANLNFSSGMADLDFYISSWKEVE